ncbi:hypothetical protein AB1Y20_016732 [Prymnesium parvum]|uniref:Uncharacterized protein n=1 Tax=Prymnesium parvum TaxID=97485 RepID=A0AB34ID96_PRYPA
MHERRSKGRLPRGDGSRGPRCSSASVTRAHRADMPDASAISVYLCARLETSQRCQVLQLGRCWLLSFVVSMPAVFSALAAAGIFFLQQLFKRAPWRRSLFIIFLLSGVNLEANIAITPGKMEKQAVKRAAEIGALEQNEYQELQAKNEAALKELPIVASVTFLQAAKLNDSYCRVNLTCTGQCGQEQQPKLRLSQKCPTLAQAAEIVHEYLLLHHQGCFKLQPTRNAGPSSSSSSCGASCSGALPAVNPFERMKESQRRVAEHKAAALRLSTAECDLERAEKRLRTCSKKTGCVPKAVNTSSRTISIPFYDRYKDWDLAQFMTRMGEVMSRRAKLCTEESRPAPRNDGSDDKDALHHWRRGLVGAVQDWADGSLENAAILILRLITHFNSTNDGFKDRVLNELLDDKGGMMKQAALHAEMIANAREAIHVLKERSTNASVRREYIAALALFAPDASSGQEYAIAKELGVHTGERSSSRTGKKRPRAFRRAMHTRAAFREQQRKATSQPFKEGDTVLCRGGGGGGGDEFTVPGHW